VGTFIHHAHPSHLTAVEPRERVGHKAVGEQLLTTEELAVFLGMSSQVLTINRMTESGIPFIRLGRSIRYRLRDVEDHLAANTVRGSAKDGA
jgi:excisionase family DNA binding protein